VQDCSDATLRRICRGTGSRSYPGCPKAPDRSLMNARESERLCPSSPPTPFSHKGRRGSLRVLKPKTRERTQEIPKKPVPVRLQTPRISRSLAGAAARCPALRLAFHIPVGCPVATPATLTSGASGVVGVVIVIATNRSAQPKSRCPGDHADQEQTHSDQ